MATLRDIRQRIVAVKGTAKITSAMKMVAAARLRRAQSSIESARPYVVKLEDMLSNLVSAIGESYTHPLIKNRDEVKSIAIIVVGSDRGLCGSFNSNLFREVDDFIKGEMKEQFPDAEASLLTIGKKSCSFFKKDNYDIIERFPGVFTKLQFETAKEMVSIVKHGFIDGTYDRVIVFYNEFINMLKQLPAQQVLLPIQPKIEEAVEEEKSFNVDYIFEPDQVAILDELFPKLLDIQLWRFLLESNAAEQASRMMAMDNATSNAKDLITQLTLMFNKKRQAIITTEMLEIVSGANALKQQ